MQNSFTGQLLFCHSQRNRFWWSVAGTAHVPVCVLCVNESELSPRWSATAYVFGVPLTKAVTQMQCSVCILKDDMCVCVCVFVFCGCVCVCVCVAIPLGCNSVLYFRYNRRMQCMVFLCTLCACVSINQQGHLFLSQGGVEEFAFTREFRVGITRLRMSRCLLILALPQGLKLCSGI